MIKELEFRNCGPFRGEHALKFKNRAYAITASYEQDPGRSNWGGKTFLLESVKFAVTGEWNEYRRFKADDWITRGEKTGSVKVVFGDGTWISRERIRGQSTQVRFFDREGKLHSQDVAARAILKHLCFDREDFGTIAYFESKQMSKLIRIAPEKRLDVVRGWLGLEKAEKAEELASEWAKGRVRELNRLRTRRTTLIGMMGSSEDLPDVDQIEEELSESKEQLDSLRKKWDLHRELRGYQKIINDFEKVTQLGKALAEKVTKAPSNLEDALKEADGALAKASARLEQTRDEIAKKKKVALGQFDGQCPVAPIECPVKKRINTDREASRKAYEEVLATKQELVSEVEKADEKASQLRLSLHEKQVEEDRLVSLRDQWERGYSEYKVAKKALKKLKKLPDEDTLRKQIREAEENYHHLVLTLGEAKQLHENVKKYYEESVRLDRDIKVESERLSVLLATKAVFRTTQRRIAEKSLAAISTSANRMLRDGGVDLSIDVRWEREGSKLASSCEMCGASFPTSTKIKVCAECSAERGQHIVQKLEFLLSDRSDAADDMAGIALQIAAGSWLLASKDSPWKTAMIDEPFAAMDRTIRRVAANQLLQLVGSSAYKQVFVISHSQETVDVYGSQIRVIILRDGTRQIEIV